jgi:hypothetical protein
MIDVVLGRKNHSSIDPRTRLYDSDYSNTQSSILANQLEVVFNHAVTGQYSDFLDLTKSYM